MDIGARFWNIQLILFVSVGGALNAVELNVSVAEGWSLLICPTYLHEDNALRDFFYIIIWFIAIDWFFILKIKIKLTNIYLSFVGNVYIMSLWSARHMWPGPFDKRLNFDVWRSYCKDATNVIPIQICLSTSTTDKQTHHTIVALAWDKQDSNHR